MPNLEESILYIPDFLTTHQADWLLDYSQKLSWKNNKIQLMGNTYNVPRLEAYYGDPGADYLYSNSVMLSPMPWTRPLERLRNLLEEKLRLRFDVVLCNKYRDGKDSISWHNDNEATMGLKPAIASISVGQVRRFKVRNNVSRAVMNFDLAHGSLLVMLPGFQDNWQHSVPKTQKQVGERVNFTFRPHVRSSRK